MEQNSKHIKDIDYRVNIGKGITQNIIFNPSKNFAEENVILFGITVRQQGEKLIIITKIYEEERRDEIVQKLGIMVAVMMKIYQNRNIIDAAHIVDQKDILEQISKRRITMNDLTENMTQEQDITVETLDLITGEMVPIEFSMKLLKIEKIETN